MIEDQAYILNQIVEQADTEQADGIIIAGDIYDKPVPSVEAVQLFDHFLTQLADHGKKVFLISGNHDSAERLGFGARLMRGRDIYISSVYDGQTKKIVAQDQYGEVCFYLLPFVKPAIVSHALSEEAGTVLPETYEDAVKLAVLHMDIDSDKRNILVAHQFVTGAGRCDSETFSIGGLDNVSAQVFDAFDYVALGHIHSPQWIGRETMRYCGTPLKYSFSEAGQQKSITVIECKEKGTLECWMIPLVPLHDMQKLRGTYLEVTARSFYQNLDREDYMHITLTDEEDIPDGMQKLRTIYPNLMQLEYDNRRTKQNRVIDAAAQMEQRSEMDLFEEFYELQNNQPMNAEQAAFVKKMIETFKS